MNITTKNLPEGLSLELYQPIIEQFPGIIALFDQKDQVLCINQVGAQLWGYPTTDNVLGITPYDIKCPAVESAPAFIQQNQLALKSDEDIPIFDIHQYADQINKIFFTKKKSVIIDGDKNHSLCICTEVNSDSIAKIAQNLLQTSKKYTGQASKIISNSYYVGHLPQAEKLTQRELECLFYVIRGKIAKEIAKIINISYRTVEVHLQNIKAKMGVNSKSDMIEYGIELGLLNYIPQSMLNQNISIEV